MTNSFKLLSSAATFNNFKLHAKNLQKCIFVYKKHTVLYSFDATGYTKHTEGSQIYRLRRKRRKQFLCFLAYSIVRSCSNDNALKYIKVYIKFKGKQIGCLKTSLGRDFGLVVFSPLPLPLPLKLGDLFFVWVLGMVRNIYVYVYTNFPYRMENTWSHSYLPSDGEGLLIS